MSDKCPNGLTPDGPVCPRCGGNRGPSGVDGGSWVHCPPSSVQSEIAKPLDDAQVDAMLSGYKPAVHPLPLNLPALTVGPVEFTEKQMDALISHMNCDLPPLEKIHQDALRNYKGPLPMPAAHPLPAPRTEALIKSDRPFAGSEYAEQAFDKMSALACTLEREAAELRAERKEEVSTLREKCRAEWDLRIKNEAELRAQQAEVKEALAGDDYASLPSDYPLVRMAHTIRADHDKFRNQVIDTCKRAETAERQRDEARAESETCFAVLRELKATFPDVRLVLDAAIDAAKEGKP